MLDHNPSDLVVAALDEGVLTLTLGAAPAHPLSLAMIVELRQALERAAADVAVKVILIHGPGRIFCAGHDLKEIARHRDDDDRGLAFIKRLFSECEILMKTISRSLKPSIAVVEGLATAAGLQLVAACDLAFVSESASFCLPGVKTGGFCTTPAVAVGRNLPRKLIAEMTLSAENFDAEWARQAGLVNRILPAAELLDFSRDFARRLAARYTDTVGKGKQTLYWQLEMPLDQAYAHATEVMISHFMDPERIDKVKAKWG